MSSTFRFENPAALQILWVIPILIFIALSIARLHGRRLKNIFSEKLFPFLTASVSVTRRRWKLILECLVLFCFIVDLVRSHACDIYHKV